MTSATQNNGRCAKDLKFNKFKSGAFCKVRWDTPMLGNKFFRIVVSLGGHYVLYACEGLSANGITPTAMVELYRSLVLRKCEDYLFTYLGIQKPQSAILKARGGYASSRIAEDTLRLPYKD